MNTYRFNSTFKVKKPRGWKPKGKYGFGARKRLKAGKRTKAWNAERRKLKAEYAAMGITTCELRYRGCLFNNMLSFAHGRKRRKLVGDELKTLTILCCIPCHDKIEFLPADEMLQIVEETIAERKEYQNGRLSS